MPPIPFARHSTPVNPRPVKALPVRRTSLARLGIVLVAGLALLFMVAQMAAADEVQVQHARFVQTGQTWTVSVTLRHADTGWADYADAWRLVDAQGRELAKRVLFHPHVDEQPFTRSLYAVHLPAGIKVLYVEGHDKVHGWSAQRLRITMDQAQGAGYTITR